MKIPDFDFFNNDESKATHGLVLMESWVLLMELTKKKVLSCSLI